MPRSKGGLTTTEGWSKANFAIRPGTKKLLGKKAIDRDLTMGETADEILTAVLEQKWVHVPLLGGVGCGGSVLAEERVEEMLWLPARMAAGADFALRARGDSMAPLIQEGDLLLVKLHETAQPGQIVIVRDGDGFGLVKRLMKVNGEVELHSENPAYEPIRRSKAEIVGRVISVTKAL